MVLGAWLNVGNPNIYSNICVKADKQYLNIMNLSKVGNIKHNHSWQIKVKNHVQM